MVIVGINEGHNATASCLVDGRLIACASEERFTGIKNDMGYPKYAIEYVLKQANIKPSEVDIVAYATCHQNPIPMKIKRNSRFSIKDYIREMYGYWKPLLFEQKITTFWEDIQKEAKFSNKEGVHYNFDFLKNAKTKEEKLELFNIERINLACSHLNISKEKVQFVEHHNCHAYYAYFASPIDKSRKTAIVTADSWGENCNATISIAQGSEIKEVFRTQMCNLARIYRWMTLLLHFKPDEHEYKVMGLAPYAKEYLKKPAYDIFKETLVVDGIDFKWKNKPSDMFFYFKEKFEQEGVRFDGIAGGLQDWLEDMLKEWITNVMIHTGADQLVYSGGLSMNVKANKVIANLSSVKSFFVAPSGSDESTAIGASYFAFPDKKNIHPLENAYLGEEISPVDAKNIVSEYTKTNQFDLIENPSNEEIADLLVQGLVIGRAVDRMEFGARSLGNRSILCDPSLWENVRKINEKIKFRDFWMPFTPSILKERADDYLVNPKKLKAPYMTLAFDTTELARETMKAAIHPYDFTARPQIVEREVNPSYYDLIKAFENKTGKGVILNTSMNLHGMPICRTANDALHTFLNSGLDALVLPGLLLIKKPVSSDKIKENNIQEELIDEKATIL